MIRRSLLLSACLVALAACSGRGGNDTREGIWSAGSSTVFPFATRVAENYQRITGGPSPRVEALGTGGGIKAFCAGVGPDTPDIANASRRLKASEFDDCRKNGVTEIIELKIGYDGIVVATARNGASFDLRIQDLYLGLARTVPGADGRLGPNPYAAWNQVNPALPAQRIQVYGPPPTSGTRDAFLELGMTAGAEKIPAVAAIADQDEDRFEEIAHTLREDNAWIDAGENDNAILQTLTRTPGSLGVFGFSFLEQNLDVVKPESIDGVMPSAEAIADGRYPLARSMYIYVKKQHVGVIPGLEEFLKEFMSDAAAGRGGYLQDRGLVPLPPAELAQQRTVAETLAVMARPE